MMKIGKSLLSLIFVQSTSLINSLKGPTKSEVNSLYSFFLDLIKFSLNSSKSLYVSWFLVFNRNKTSLKSKCSITLPKSNNSTCSPDSFCINLSFILIVGEYKG